MNLTEAQAKRILQGIGVAVPAGAIAQSEEAAAAALGSLGPGPWVIKAQIQSGGRARGYFQGDTQGLSGVRFASTEAQVRTAARQMLGRILVTDQTGPSGERVRSLYLEDRLSTQRELYLALAIERETGGLAFLASAEGGTDIEQLATTHPDAVGRWPVAIDATRMPTGIGAFLQLSGHAATALDALLLQLHSLFIDRDATLIEINPLVVTSEGDLMALDATIVWDDNALFRQGHEEQLTAYDDLHPVEYEALQKKLNYVRLPGNVGCLAVGAGMAMATVDAVVEFGGKPGSFLDVSPSADVSDMHAAIELMLNDDGSDGVLINVFGGGIMRCDVVASALLEARQSGGTSSATDNSLMAEKPVDNKPIAVRLSGVNSELARERLLQSAPEVVTHDDIGVAAEDICQRLAAVDTRTRAGLDGKKTLWQRVRKLLPEGA